MIIKFLTVSQVLEMHAICIHLFGGKKGLISKNLLESAVLRMQASFDGKDLYVTIFEKAAAMCESLVKNHAFFDGNKRIAFIAAVTFLDINGYSTKFNKNKTEKFILDVIIHKKNFKDIARFFKNNSTLS